MRLRFFSMLLLSAKMVSAQWVDDFSDGDFSRQPVWSGDTSSFNVSPAGQLQLNAADAGTEVLFTPISLSDLNGMEWRFRIHLDFSPSSSNYARVYLATDQPGTTGNGYFLQFGEALSNDAVELFRQDGVSMVSVCRAADGAIASAFDIGVKVVRDRDAIWSLSIDPLGGTRYQLEAVGAEGMYSTSTWLGLQCTHTISNSTRFHFDDFYVGPIVEDTVQESVAISGDVVFSEIYFEPITDSDLPEEEFIELYNRSADAFKIDGWQLSDGSSTGIFPAGSVIGPGAYLLLCSLSDTAVINDFGPAIGISGFPLLNNDVGDRLVLSDRSGLIIDAVSFSDETYTDPDKEGGGWTIERKDTAFICEDVNNWTASLDPSGGTPGKINSVSGRHTDSVAPYLNYAWMQDSAQLEVFFSEAIDTGSVDPVEALSIKDSQGNEVDHISAWAGADRLTVQLTSPTSGETYRISADSTVRDCPGNGVQEGFITVAKAEKAEAGDIVFNELLSDPLDGTSDFFEIVNRSVKPIDLYELHIAKTEMNNSTPTSIPSRLTEQHRLLFPGELIAFSRTPQQLLIDYPASDSKKILASLSMPDFNIEEGGAILTNDDGETIDWFPYESSMHFPALPTTDGVSLERISFHGLSTDRSRWHSAAGDAGFATPGRRNSQFVDHVGFSSDITLDPVVFTPDNDGRSDVLLLQYDFADPGRISTLMVFSEEGRFVRSLLVGESLGTTGSVIWDGTDEAGVPLPQGRYVLWMSTLSELGEENDYRMGCGIVY